MSKKYVICYARTMKNKPNPHVVKVIAETANLWGIEKDGEESYVRKALCSTQTYTRKTEAERDCKKHAKALMDSSRDNQEIT